MRGATKKRRQQTAQLHGAIHCSAPAEQRSGSRAQLEQLVLFSRCTAQQYSMADRPKRRAASRPKLPSASHYVGYVDDSETPEMIAKKFEALERVQGRRRRRARARSGAGQAAWTPRAPRAVRAPRARGPSSRRD